jgi:hypothetical protein
MKYDVMPSLVQLEKKELQKLCAQVKETIATNVKLSEKKSSSFGTMDLWNMRRTMKTAGRLGSYRAKIQPLV